MAKCCCSNKECQLLALFPATLFVYGVQLMVLLLYYKRSVQLLASAAMNGGTVFRSLMHEFPSDSNAQRNQEQFLWGPALLVSPALYKVLVCI